MLALFLLLKCVLYEGNDAFEALERNTTFRKHSILGCLLYALLSLNVPKHMSCLTVMKYSSEC